MGDPAGVYLNNVADLNTDGDLLTLFRADFLTEVGTLVTDMMGACTSGNFDAYERDVQVGDNTIYRLREGIERFFISDINNPAASAKAQSEIAILQDEVNAELNYGGGGSMAFNHVPGGGNVLYLDGHVEFLKYPSEWPVCVTWANFLSQAGDLL